MALEQASPLKNGLLAKVAPSELEALRPLLQPVRLAQGEYLFEAFRPIEYAYFLESGLSSEIAGIPGGERIEVGCIGHEGFSGIPAALGVENTPHHAFMQASGHAHRIRSSELREAMDKFSSFRWLILKYVHVFMIQVASTALADGRYRVDQRLARWLLMCQDRLNGKLPLTHEFLALMLGVRRPSVTDALHVLEGKHFIKAERGLISVLDRKGLEDLAGTAYGLSEAEYRKVIL